MPSHRFNREILRAWKAELSDWADADRFGEALHRIRQTPGFREAMFRQAGLGFFRDAWIAHRLAVHLSAAKVRLCPQARPDFELDIGREIRRYEATEADMPGRRRGDEPFDPGMWSDPVEEWRRRFDAIHPAVSNVIGKKVGKTYDPDTRLAVYVNLGCYGAYLAEGVGVLREATMPAKDHFREVLALWEGNLYCLWRDGRSDRSVWKPTDAIDD